MKAGLVLAWILCLGTACFAAKFKDIPSDHWALPSVERLVSMGVIDGYEDGTFRGRKTVTRYELALYLSNFSKLYEKKQTQQIQELRAQVEALQRQVQLLSKK